MGVWHLSFLAFRIARQSESPMNFCELSNQVWTFFFSVFGSARREAPGPGRARRPAGRAQSAQAGLRRRRAAPPSSACWPRVERAVPRPSCCAARSPGVESCTCCVSAGGGPSARPAVRAGQPDYCAQTRRQGRAGRLGARRPPAGLSPLGSGGAEQRLQQRLLATRGTGCA